MALNINGTTGISGVDGSASAASIAGTDANTGLSFASDTVNINTGGTTRATVDSSGRLLVGATSTSQTHTLQVQADNNANAIAILGRASDDIGELSYYENDRSTKLGELQFRTTEASFRHRVGGANLLFSTTPSGGSMTERMRIDSAGSVLVGFTSSATPDFQFQAGNATAAHMAVVNTTAAASQSATISFCPANSVTGSQITCTSEEDFSTNANRTARLTFSTRKDGTLSERMRIDSSGNVLFHQSNSSVPGLANQHVGASFENLGSNGSALFISRADSIGLFINRNNTGQLQSFRAAGSEVGSISTNGSSLPSDRNFKKNITDLTLGLDFVNTLKPSKYNLKLEENTDPLLFGLIAQDVEESLTAAGVSKNSVVLCQHNPTESETESDYNLDYGKLTPILINAVKELSAKITTLETKVAALEAA